MRFALILASIAWICVTASFAAEAATAPPATAPAWGEGSGFMIPTNGKHIAFGPAGCPVVVVGGDLWELNGGKPLGEMPELEKARDPEISADGKYVVAYLPADRGESNRIGVWSTQTRQKEREIQFAGADKYLEMLRLLGNGKLLTVGRDGAKAVMEIWDLATGKQEQSYPCERMSREDAAISADGRYLARRFDSELRLIDIKAGRIVAAMQSPPIEPTPRENADQANARTRELWLKLDRDRLFWSMKAIEFSPDGKELAALFCQETMRLVVWNMKGQVVYDAVPNVAPHVGFAKRRLTWSPDGAAWLIDSAQLLERKSKRVVMRIEPEFPNEAHGVFLDPGHLVVSRSNDRALQPEAIPWEEIRKSAETMASRTPAYLRPGIAISVDIEIARLVGGDEASVRKSLTDAMASRLARDGIKVAENQSMIFQIRYEEAQGENLKIIDRATPFDRGHDTGRTATESKGTAVVLLKVKGYDTPVWKQSLEAQSGRSFREEINDATLRQSMVENLTRQVKGLEVPYFIPGDRKLLPLPVVIR